MLAHFATARPHAAAAAATTIALAQWSTGWHCHATKVS